MKKFIGFEELMLVRSAIDTLTKTVDAIETRAMEQNKFPKTIDFYMYANKDMNYDQGERLGLSDDAKQQFVKCCYEIKLTLLVYEDGTANVSHFNGVELETLAKVC
jgi:hypothetical protein